MCEYTVFGDKSSRAAISVGVIPSSLIFSIASLSCGLIIFSSSVNYPFEFACCVRVTTRRWSAEQS